jgi:thiamine kinase-like enzyme
MSLIDYSSAIGSETLSCINRLLGSDFEISSIGIGGNNKVWKVQSESKSFVIKTYCQHHADGHNRMLREWDTLCLLDEQKIIQIAKPVNIVEQENTAIYTWLDGGLCSTCIEGDSNQLGAFLSQLIKIPTTKIDFPEAASACLSPGKAIRQFKQRLAALELIKTENSDIDRFLNESLLPTAERVFSQTYLNLNNAGIKQEDSLDLEFQVFSPSDFGLHNALRTENGKLNIIDFEYFGRDDPAKMLSDAILHPGSNLSFTDASILLSSALNDLVTRDPNLISRMNSLLPVYAMIWSLIALNVYLPEFETRRSIGSEEKLHDSILAQQLKKSYTLLDKTNYAIEEKTFRVIKRHVR